MIEIEIKSLNTTECQLHYLWKLKYTFDSHSLVFQSLLLKHEVTTNYISIFLHAICHFEHLDNIAEKYFVRYQ